MVVFEGTEVLAESDVEFQALFGFFFNALLHEVALHQALEGLFFGLPVEVLLGDLDKHF